MSEIIEIIGAPGVGKTTIYKALEKRWKKKDPWAPQVEFMPRLQTSKTANPGYWLNSIRRLLGKTFIDQKQIISSAYTFLQRNTAFSSVCWDLIHKNRTKDHLGVDNRFRSAYHVYKVMGTYQAIIDSPNKRICVTDELLTHRIIQLTEETINQDEIREFVSAMPLPKGIICIDTPVDLLTKRSTGRKRNIIRHQGRSSSELMQLASLDRAKLLFVCKELEQRGVPVLYVDASRNINWCLNEIIQQLLKLSKQSLK